MSDNQIFATKFRLRAGMKKFQETSTQLVSNVQVIRTSGNVGKESDFRCIAR